MWTSLSLTLNLTLIQSWLGLGLRLRLTKAKATCKASKAKAKAKAQAKVNPKDPILTPRRSPRFQAAIFKLAMLSALMAGVVVAETPRWVPVEAPMGTNDTAIRELILREGVPGTVPEWRAGYV